MEAPLSENEQMKADYPHFRAFVVAKMKQEFAQTLQPVVGGDLRKTAQDVDALPLLAFIEDLRGKYA